MSQTQVKAALEDIKMGTVKEVHTQVQKNGITITTDQVRGELLRMYNAEIADRILSDKSVWIYYSK